MQAVPNTFIRQQAETSRTVITLPGPGYTVGQLGTLLGDVPSQAGLTMLLLE